MVPKSTTITMKNILEESKDRFEEAEERLREPEDSTANRRKQQKLKNLHKKKRKKRGNREYLKK